MTVRYLWLTGAGVLLMTEPEVKFWMFTAKGCYRGVRLKELLRCRVVADHWAIEPKGA